MKTHRKKYSKKEKTCTKVRLNKFIANSGICSRREADKFIEAGVIKVNGVSVTEMGYKINASDNVKFNNETINSETARYILLNKPKNYSEKTKNIEKNSINLVSSACKERIYPVDRLNNIETGLLLFTNDSDLKKKLSNKSLLVKSVYEITLDKNLILADFDKIKKGFFINGKKRYLDSISYVYKKPKNEIGIEHSFGGIPYIKNIFESLNYNIKKLDRVFFGGLTKKNLPRKKYRHLAKDEISILKRI